MMGALLVSAVAGVAWAATIQCDGVGDTDPDPGQCAGTNDGDVITGTTKADIIRARGSGNQVDQVMARGGRDKVLGGNGADFLFGGAAATPSTPARTAPHPPTPISSRVMPATTPWSKAAARTGTVSSRAGERTR